MLALCLALATATTALAVAAPSSSTRIEDQNDRRLRHLRADQARQEQAAVALARRMERDLPLAPAASVAATQPAVRTGTAVPRPGVGVLVTLLLGLVGGLVGGCAAMVGWTATTRRRLHHAASAT
jgi:hypothetical protein